MTCDLGCKRRALAVHCHQAVANGVYVCVCVCEREIFCVCMALAVIYLQAVANGV